jgi:hypothetical protein
MRWKSPPVAPSFVMGTWPQLSSLILSKLGHKHKVMHRRKEEDYVPPKRFRTCQRLRRTSSSIKDRFHLVRNPWRNAVTTSSILFNCLGLKPAMDRAGEKLILSKQSWRKYGLVLTKTSLDRQSKASFAHVRSMETKKIAPRKDNSLRRPSLSKRKSK